MQKGNRSKSVKHQIYHGCYEPWCWSGANVTITAESCEDADDALSLLSRNNGEKVSWHKDAEAKCKGIAASDGVAVAKKHIYSFNRIYHSGTITVEKIQIRKELVWICWWLFTTNFCALR